MKELIRIIWIQIISKSSAPPHKGLADCDWLLPSLLGCDVPVCRSAVLLVPISQCRFQLGEESVVELNLGNEDVLELMSGRCRWPLA